MSSSKEYLNFILEQLSELEDISYRAMMGEYIVKPVKSAIDYMPDAKYELPYEGAKAMLLVDNVDNRKYLMDLFEVMFDELPVPKVKKKK